MNKKWLLGIILVLTCLAIIFIIILKFGVRYNKLIIKEENWNSIISNRNMSTSLKFENIEFNDYDLLIDEENSTIYYSIVNSNKKYNPSLKYKANSKVNIAINDSITDDKIDQENDLKIMLYNDNSYRIYSLVTTNYPILNVTTNNEFNDKNKANALIYLFDNHVDSPMRVLKSDGKFKIIKENSEYSFSLKKESVGHKTRENHISIFGMEKIDEYLIKKASTTNQQEKYVQLFINSEYKGLYSFGHKEGRIDNFERNKENNR